MACGGGGVEVEPWPGVEVEGGFGGSGRGAVWGYGVSVCQLLKCPSYRVAEYNFWQPEHG